MLFDYILELQTLFVSSTMNIIGRAYVTISFTLDYYNYSILKPIMKLEMTICVITITKVD